MRSREARRLLRLRVPGGGLLLLGGLSGCLFPFPHSQQRSPRIVGVLTAADAPLARVPIRELRSFHGAQERCEGPVVTSTDARGQFVVPSTAEFELFFVFGDRFDSYQLCFELPDGEPGFWRGSGMWGGPRLIELRCRLAGSGAFECVPPPRAPSSELGAPQER
jgi:hypothetical protein